MNSYKKIIIRKVVKQFPSIVIRIIAWFKLPQIICRVISRFALPHGEKVSGEKRTSLLGRSDMPET